jgi:carboxypeptidase C (cathepsin A)
MQIFYIAILLLVKSQALAIHQQQLRNSASPLKQEPIVLPEIGFRGYIPVKYGTYFYWGFYAHKNPDTAPLFIWLCEGPGASIFMPIFAANGPFSVDEDITISPNEYAFNK